jgi:hypothetical protein
MAEKVELFYSHVPRILARKFELESGWGMAATLPPPRWPRRLLCRVPRRRRHPHWRMPPSYHPFELFLLKSRCGCAWWLCNQIPFTFLVLYFATSRTGLGCAWHFV